MIDEKKKILLVDDEEVLVRLVREVLTEKGYEVFTASDGQEALRLFFLHRPDLVLLDVIMPQMDGWHTCSRIRELSDVPIVMLTGKSKTEEDIVRGLDYGADDYLIKPVGNRELVARLKAILRRSELSPSSTSRENTYADGYLSVDIPSRKVLLNNRLVKLTPTEFSLLALLVQNPGRILTHKQLLEKVWGWEYGDDLDYVRIYIWHLRQKVEPDPTKPKYIMTESGVGYYFQKANK
ncbi:MAG: response regulator transcription factor [Chloroflexota bacterium]